MTEAGGDARHGAAVVSESLVGRYRRLACLSVAPWNPYLELLYGALADQGIELEPDRGCLRLRWLVAARHRVGFLHVHWPEGLYTFQRGPAPVRAALSWPKLLIFATRLRVARWLGYRLVWTIHQVYPHDRRAHRLDLLAGKVLARSCGVLVAHDASTARAAREELGASTVDVTAHGSYAGVYPAGRPREVVRSELGIPGDAVVFLSFGELRAYKDVDVLIDAFRTASLPSACLVVAGHVTDERVGRAVAAAAAADGSVRWVKGFVPSEHVAELYGASDVAVIPRGDGGTSGSLILALSLGAPVIAVDAPAYRELTLDGEAGWLFRAGDSASLRDALEHAVREPAAVEQKGRVAAMAAERLDWAPSAERLASLLRAAARA